MQKYFITKNYGHFIIMYILQTIFFANKFHLFNERYFLPMNRIRAPNKNMNDGLSKLKINLLQKGEVLSLSPYLESYVRQPATSKSYKSTRHS